MQISTESSQEEQIIENNEQQQRKSLTLVCISDTHGKFIEVPNGDVLIHCGDFTNWGQADEIQAFINWLKQQPHKHKIVVPGNQDIGLDVQDYQQRLQKKFHYYNPLNPQDQLESLSQVCHVLINSSIVIEGHKFWGSPYQKEQYGWAFEIHNNVNQFWQENIDSDCEVIITHNAPYYYGDRFNNKNMGDLELQNRVREVRPKLHIFGGVHESYGIFTEGNGYYQDSIKFVNCSIMDNNFELHNKPFVLTL